MRKTYSRAALALLAADISTTDVGRGADVTPQAITQQLNGRARVSDATITAVRALGGAELADEIKRLATEAWHERRPDVEVAS